MRLLKALLFLELWLGCFWVIPAVSPEAGLELLMVFSFTGPIHLLCMVIATWWLVKRPPTRRLAASALLAPVALFVLPFPLRTVFGELELGRDPLASAGWIAALLPLVACVLLPRQVALYLPQGLWRSRGLNLAILALLGGLLATFLAVFLALLSGAFPWPEGDNLRLQPEIIVGLVLLLPVSCVVLPFPISLFGWVGLFQPQGRCNQGLRIAQLALCAALVAIASPLCVVIYAMALGGPG